MLNRVLPDNKQENTVTKTRLFSILSKLGTLGRYIIDLLTSCLSSSDDDYDDDHRGKPAPKMTH